MDLNIKAKVVLTQKKKSEIVFIPAPSGLTYFISNVELPLYNSINNKHSFNISQKFIN